MDLLELKYLFSYLIGTCMAAGMVVGINELCLLWRNGLLNRACITEMALSASMTPPYSVISYLLFPAWYALYHAVSDFSLLTPDMSVASVLIAYLLVDLSYYLEHRCAHQIPLLWSLYHAPHHSSKAYTIATAYRVSFLSLFFAPIFYLPWLLLGYDPLLVIGMQMFVFHYQAWVHTETVGRLGILDTLFNTPANHRMHHSKSPAHRDVNMGATLMIWDHLFGTYQKPEPIPGYGIAGKDSPRRPLDIYFDGFRKPRQSVLGELDSGTD